MFTSKNFYVSQKVVCSNKGPLDFKKGNCSLRVWSNGS